MENNYLIIENENSNNDVCYVFCSSNGIFWNARDKDYVIKNNYFEFQNIARDKRISDCKKIIFLRDMDISFYVNGINKKIDSIPKIINFVKEETKGLSVIVMGISAGGYLANILGLYLDNVIKVFGVGTVFNIREWKGRHAFLESEYLTKSETDKGKSYFFNLYNLFDERMHLSKPIFYYLYGSKNVYDIEISNKTRGKINDPRFVFLPIKSRDHGVRFSYNSFISLLTTSKNLKSTKKAYSKISFIIKVAGLKNAIYYLLLDIKYKLFKKRIHNNVS